MSDPADTDDADLRTTELRSFGRRRARTFGPRQQRLWSENLSKFTLDLTQPAATQLPADRDVWLEIGFGGAEHLLWQAGHNPDVTLIGCEPFEDGVVKALGGIEDRALGNIRLHADDARPLLRWLPDHSVSRAFILFPDPWPKKKHVKRRLIGTPLLDELARVMNPGAELRVGTDIGDYARTILLAIMPHPAFEWPARGPEDWRIRGEDWPETRYEQKAVREGRARYYFRFRRRMTP
jgi:tRNA (guanine-N7-)-methyltransferase